MTALIAVLAAELIAAALAALLVGCKQIKITIQIPPPQQRHRTPEAPR